MLPQLLTSLGVFYGWQVVYPVAFGRPRIWITHVAVWTFVVFSGIRAPRTAVGSWAAGHLHAGSLAQLSTSGTSSSAPSFSDQQSVSIRT